MACFLQCLCAYENIPSFECPCDAFVKEEMRLKIGLGNYEDVLDLSIIEKVRKEGNKARFWKG